MILKDEEKPWMRTQLQALKREVKKKLDPAAKKGKEATDDAISLQRVREQLFDIFFNHQNIISDVIENWPVPKEESIHDVNDVLYRIDRVDNRLKVLSQQSDHSSLDEIIEKRVDAVIETRSFVKWLRVAGLYLLLGAGVIGGLIGWVVISSYTAEVRERRDDVVSSFNRMEQNARAAKEDVEKYSEDAKEHVGEKMELLLGKLTERVTEAERFVNNFENTVVDQTNKVSKEYSDKITVGLEQKLKEAEDQFQRISVKSQVFAEQVDGIITEQRSLINKKLEDTVGKLDPDIQNLKSTIENELQQVTEKKDALLAEIEAKKQAASDTLDSVPEMVRAELEPLQTKAIDEAKEAAQETASEITASRAQVLADLTAAGQEAVSEIETQKNTTVSEVSKARDDADSKIAELTAGTIDGLTATGEEAKTRIAEVRQETAAQLQALQEEGKQSLASAKDDFMAAITAMKGSAEEEIGGHKLQAAESLTAEKEKALEIIKKAVSAQEPKISQEFEQAAAQAIAELREKLAVAEKQSLENVSKSAEVTLEKLSRLQEKELLDIQAAKHTLFDSWKAFHDQAADRKRQIDETVAASIQQAFHTGSGELASIPARLAANVQEISVLKAERAGLKQEVADLRKTLEKLQEVKATSGTNRLLIILMPILLLLLSLGLVWLSTSRFRWDEDTNEPAPAN